MEETILAVQRMQDYIATHFSEEITMAELGTAALFSPWYAYRLFRRYTGKTPPEYIRCLRLAGAAEALKRRGVRVSEIAFEAGFGSVDGFQRAFRHEFGCNPAEYRKSPVPIPLFIPYGVKFQNLRKDCEKMPNTQSIFIQVIQKPARKVLVRRGKKAKDYFSYCEEVGCDVWGLLTSMDSLCGEPVSLWLPKKYQKPESSEYVQGVEAPLDFKGALPEGFDEIILPAAEYLMFQGEPFREEDYCEAINAVQDAMNRYQPEWIGYEWDDENPRTQLEPRGERGYIELRAVKPKKTK